ncbi:MAG: hypothetical protein MJE77_41890 [Proteobacteria bacterium]|nr:hypothetical protein [Pseudomonadota bacterium]
MQLAPAAKGSAADAALMEQLMKAAIRPDLYSVPLERATTAESNGAEAQEAQNQSTDLPAFSSPENHETDESLTDEFAGLLRRSPALEADADRAATAVMTGQRPAVQFSASFGMAQAFSESESRDPAEAGLEEPADIFAQNFEQTLQQEPPAQNAVESAGTASDSQDGQPTEDPTQSEQAAGEDPQEAASEERSQAKEANAIPRQGFAVADSAQSTAFRTNCMAWLGTRLQTVP